MKTRSAARIACVKEDEEAKKQAEIDKQRSDAEKWVKEGRVINPKIREPPADLMEMWRLFVNSAQKNPNLLAHSDIQCVRDLFQLLGVYVTYETCSLIIELDECVSIDEDGTFIQPLRPYQEQDDEWPLGNSNPLSSVFGKIESLEVIPNTNACIIREYRLMNDLKSALEDLVDFVWTYPECLLYPQFAFLHDFLVRFGVSPDTITYEIYCTQRRREQGKYPASTFLVKLGVPEGVALKMEEESDENDHYDGEDEWKQMDHGRRTSGSISDDSGFGTDSSIDSPTKSSSSHIVTATKTKVEFHSHLLMEEDSLEDNEFRCTVCGRTYVSKGNCNWHIRKRHPGAPLLPGSKTDSFLPDLTYFCSLCGKGFTAPKYLKNHEERLHPNEFKRGFFKAKAPHTRHPTTSSSNSHSLGKNLKMCRVELTSMVKKTMFSSQAPEPEQSETRTRVLRQRKF